MIKRQFFTRWLALPILITTALLASACDANLSGEPEIMREAEIVPFPTNLPSPTPDPANAPTATEPAAPTDDDPGDTAAQDDTALTASGDYDLGFEVYLRECASCHGAGDGVGPSLRVMHDNAATRVEGMSGAEYVRQSIVDPGAYIVDGYNDVMPPDYASRLTEEEIAGLVTFVLEFDPARMGMGGDASGSSGGDGAGTAPDNPDVAATSESAVGPALASGETLTVSGELIAGTGGGEAIPAGLPVQLYAVDPHGNLAGVYQGESTAEQTFTIENVARSVGMTYFVEVQYQGVPQGTRIASIQGDEDEVSTAITLYERTTTADTVAITWAEMLVNYAPVDDIGIEVWLDVEIANMGDTIVTTDERAEHNDWYVSVNIELPVGAFGIQPMQAQNSQRYTVEVIDGVPVVKDTWPLRPNQAHTITVAYYLPYDTGAIIEHAFNYPVMDGMVLLPNDTVDFASEQFDTSGEWRGRVADGGASVDALQPNETIDPERDFTLIKAHDLLKPVSPDERITFELAGRPTRTLDLINPNAAASDDTDDNNLLPLILGALGVGIIIVAGVMFWRQGRAEARIPQAGPRRTAAPAWQPPRADATKEDLLAALATLDDAYEAGELDDETYYERRAIVADRLVPLLDEQNED